MLTNFDMLEQTSEIVGTGRGSNSGALGGQTSAGARLQAQKLVKMRVTGASDSATSGSATNRSAEPEESHVTTPATPVAVTTPSFFSHLYGASEECMHQGKFIDHFILCRKLELW